MLSRKTIDSDHASELQEEEDHLHSNHHHHHHQPLNHSVWPARSSYAGQSVSNFASRAEEEGMIETTSIFYEGVTHFACFT